MFPGIYSVAYHFLRHNVVRLFSHFARAAASDT